VLKYVTVERQRIKSATKDSVMSVPLDSLVGEVHLIEGARQSSTPATGVFTAPRRAARGRMDDMLYVLIDLVGDVSSADLHDVMEPLTHAYWSMPGSVTSALRAALNAAGTHLMDRNTNAPLPERLTGGVVCAVLRGSAVYIAQAGPTNVFIAQDNSLEHYPTADAEPLAPIGTARAVEMRFAHAQLNAGDTMLLTDARFGSLVTSDAIGKALTHTTVDKALESLERLIGKGDLIALVVQAAPADTVEPKPTSTAAVATVAAVTAAVVSPIEPAAPTVEAPPASVPSASAPPADNGPIIRVAGRPSAAPTPVALPAPTGAPQPRATSAPTTAAPIAAAKATSISPAQLTGEANARAWLDALKHGFRRGAGSVGAAGAIVADRTLPGSTQVKTPQLTRNQTLVMVAIVIGIAVVVALLVAAVYTQRAAVEAVLSHIQTAKNEIQAAASAVTGKETRQHWAAAAAEAKQALQLDPQNKDAAQVLAQAQLELDKIDNVISLTPNLLWDFKSQGQQHLASQSFSLFVLDRTANQVNRLILNTAGDKLEGEPEPILVPGVTVNGQTPGNLIDIASLGSSINRQASDLVIGHDKGLVKYNQSFGLQTVPFGNNKLPASAKRMRTFDGKLYTLDPNAQQIMKYEPVDAGYPNAPTPYFAEARPELAKATDLAIDGSIYVTTSDGKILKFSEGRPDTFDLRGLGEPLQRPTIVALDQNVQDSSLYVVDAVLRRIVQLRTDGLFVRQFRADDAAFDNIQDLLIDEQNNRLYIIGQGAVYTLALPPVR
jgi:hypothetical protein